MRLGERFRNRFSKAIIANSEPVARVAKYIEHIPDEKLNVIHSGISAPLFSVDREEARTRLGLPLDALVVANVANLKPVKNQAILIRTVKAMSDSGFNIHLLIAGEGELRSQLTGLSDELGVADRVHLLGELHDTTAVYRASDAYAHSSLAEGLPTAVIEAMHSGLPVVATRAGGTVDLVVDSENGALVDDDVEAFSAVLSNWAVDSSVMAALGRKGLEMARDRFSLNAMIQKYESLYERLLS